MLREHFAASELQALRQVAGQWAREELSGFEARKRVLRDVLRGQSHMDVGMSSATWAASEAGERGASVGANIGHDIASSVTSAFSDTVKFATANTRFQPGENVQTVGHVAAEVVNLLGMLAGGAVGGVSTAIVGGTQAGMESRRAFTFVDRLFLRSTRDQAWELSAQTLNIEGVQPHPQAVEDMFKVMLRSLLDHGCAASQQAPQGLWLQLVQLCLSFELLKCLPAPPTRVELPKEPLLVQLRLDEEYLSNRVRELAGMIDQISGGKPSGMSSQRIHACCPSERLASNLDDACPICLEQLSAGEKVRKLPCGHVMHCECGDRWLETAGTCPTCRRDARS